MDPGDRWFLLADISRIVAIALCLLCLCSRTGRQTPPERVIPMPQVDDARHEYQRSPLASLPR